MKSKITIITPSFNQAQYLEQTIDSVLSQNCPNLEYFVIDGGSNDGSVEIIKKYSKHLSWWTSEPDDGQSHAINKGLKRATGEVINWLNSDDYYNKDALKRVSEAFEDKNITCFTARSRLFNKKGTVSHSGGTDIYEGNLPKTIGMARIDQPETFFRSVAWQTLGGVNQHLHYTMDREWWMRYLFAFGLNGIVQSNDVIVNFRLHESSKTVSESVKFQNENNRLFQVLSECAQYDELSLLLNKYSGSIGDIGSALSNLNAVQLIKESLNYFCLNKAHEYYYQNNSDKASEFLKLVRPELLSTSDKKLYSKIKFRNTFVPKFLINRFRKSND